MRNSTFVTENELDEWVRSHAEEAQGLVVNLTSNLVVASVPQPIERRFPQGDSISQHGVDGYLESDSAFLPFIPNGKSYWEIGSGIDAREKATTDYKKLTETTPSEERKAATFVFVTPLSARRGWKETQQRSWIKQRREKGDWKNVVVLDGTKIIEWLRYFPTVDRWLAVAMDKHGEDYEILAERWVLLKTIGEPPPLIPELFLLNRDNVVKKLDDLFARNSLQLRIQTRYPLQITDIVAAYAESRKAQLQDQEQRCLIVKSLRALTEVVQLPDAHFIVIDFAIDSEEETAVRVLQIAKNKGHGIIYAAAPGGIPHANQVPLYDPTAHQMQVTLEKSGYTRERARRLSLKSGDSLRILLLCIQNLSLAPEWAQGTDAAELAIATLLGSWNESNESDREVTEQVSGKAYGEWVAVVRKAANLANTPLSLEHDRWSLISRYEAWYTLARHIDRTTLERFRSTVLRVFKVRDRQFDVPTEERYRETWASQEKLCTRPLRRGLAETLALIENHTSALILCDLRYCHRLVYEIVITLLKETDWKHWATIEDFLPLLAEASPRAMLESIDFHLSADESIFEELFNQERGGSCGREYMSGILWALETIAWEREFFLESVLILGELAARDPGGQWANRPINTLRQIFLPWMPQTTADPALRKTAIKTLMQEQPEVCWKLLIELLPHSSDTSSGTRKPTWRVSTPEDIREFPSMSERIAQEMFVANLAADMAVDSNSRLELLIPKLAALPRQVRLRVLQHLKTKAIGTLDIDTKFRIWTELNNLALHHARYPNSEWVISKNEIREIEDAATTLTPDDKSAIYQRLFSEREYDLFEDSNDYAGQSRLLESKRRSALLEIVEAKGIKGLLDFVHCVEAPWRVGYSYGQFDVEEKAESSVLKLLLSDDANLKIFVGAFIQSRFNRHGWNWVDQSIARRWRIEKRGRFLSYLPFEAATWERVSLFLGKGEAAYWTCAEVNPYRVDGDLKFGILKLVEYGRPLAALPCLERDIYRNGELQIDVATEVLSAIADDEGPLNSVQAHSVVEVIKALQKREDVPEESLRSIEWKFLPILSGYGDHRALMLERTLAKDPIFFVELLKVIFHPAGLESKEPLDGEMKARAENAFRLFWHWSYPPGLNTDGTFDQEVFLRWVDEAVDIARKEHRYEIALEKIGHVLRYVPVSDEGLWLPRAVAEVLNRRENEAMRDGFRSEWINSRGAYWGTEGKEETKLAQKYLKYAESSDREGYSKLARTMRDLAQFYSEEASLGRIRDFD